MRSSQPFVISFLALFHAWGQICDHVLRSGRRTDVDVLGSVAGHRSPWTEECRTTSPTAATACFRSGIEHLRGGTDEVSDTTQQKSHYKEPSLETNPRCRANIHMYSKYSFWHTFFFIFWQLFWRFLKPGTHNLIFRSHIWLENVPNSFNGMCISAQQLVWNHVLSRLGHSHILHLFTLTTSTSGIRSRLCFLHRDIYFGFCQPQHFGFAGTFWMKKGQCGVPAGLQCSVCVTPVRRYLSTFNPQFPKWKRKWNHWCHWSKNPQVEWNIDALSHRSIQYQAQKIRKRQFLFLNFSEHKVISALRRLSVGWKPPTCCDDLHPSSAKLNCEWSGKRICWRDSLISRMCDHTLKLCTFPFPPRRPRGLLLRIDALRSLLLFGGPGRVLSWRFALWCRTLFHWQFQQHNHPE